MIFSRPLPSRQPAREPVGLRSLARRISLGLGLGLALLALPADAAQLVLRVTVTNDSGVGSFREAILAANQAGKRMSLSCTIVGNPSGGG